MPVVDRKYKIKAINPSSLNTHTEADSILFLAKDLALPATLQFYHDECERLGADISHLTSIKLLRERVLQYQKNNETKIPDTNTPEEIARCIDGKLE